MSIVPLHKVTCCGLTAEKGAVLEGLQRLGCLHLVSLRPPPAEPEALPSLRPEAAYKALKHLLDCPHKRRPIHEDEAFAMDAVVQRTLDNQQRLRQASDQRDFLIQRIRAVEPWSEFRFPPLEALAGMRLWFYVIPHYKMRQVQDSNQVWQLIHRDNRHSYVVIVAPQEPPAQAMPVPRTRMGALSLSELRRRLERVEIDLEELVAERQELTRWLFLLSRNLAQAEDRAALEHAASLTLEREGVFAVQGWAPVADLSRLQVFAAHQSLTLLVEAPGPRDAPPTLLHNTENVAGGQEVVAFYQMPGYRTWDPSGVIFFSFALFFAMILADAGYALLFTLALLAFHRRLEGSPQGRRLRTLGHTIAAMAIVYGVLSGGYFGAAPPQGSLLTVLHLINVNDFDAMMRLSVVIGVGHLVVANAVIAWRRRASASRLAPLGWIAILLGALMGWSAIPGGAWLVGGGVAAVFLFTSERAVTGPRDILWRTLDGLLALTGLSKAFGDVLSYLRLFALGLASASLALTFNQLAFGAIDTVPGLGVLLCVLILVLGHALNFALCVVSGVVHGLRLNLIEFYHWGISDEGYPFKAFAKKETGDSWTI